VSELHTPGRLDELRNRVDLWLTQFADENRLVSALDRGTSDNGPLGEPQWYVRMLGEDKEFTTVWLTLGQRTLRYETYVMPAPEEHVEQVLELLLRRNDQLVGVHFSIGAEDAVYLRGELFNTAVTARELDRVLGTIYTAVEASFSTLVRLGFASRFRD
jgi:hypothetical protein